MGTIVGIDLGTNNSTVSILAQGRPKTILNLNGSALTPSVVAWTEHGEVLVGEAAKRQAATNPENTVSSALRFLSARPGKGDNGAALLPSKVAWGPNGEAQFAIRGKYLAPQEILARVLQELKWIAEEHLGEDVTAAVVAVPVGFGIVEHRAIRDACAIAGLECKRTLASTAAAALAYALDRKKDEIIAIFDFGGGNFGTSILEVSDCVVQDIATHGDAHLGGDDIDRLIMNWLISEFHADTGIDVSGNAAAIQRLKDSAEQAKIDLSSRTDATIDLPFLTTTAAGSTHLRRTLTRFKLEGMIRPLIERTLESVTRALSDARKRPEEIDRILLVGGSTRIPAVVGAVGKFFAKEPCRAVSTDEAVAAGAAVQAGVLSGDVKDMVILEITPRSLGCEHPPGRMTVVIPRCTTIPFARREILAFAGDTAGVAEVRVLEGEFLDAQANRTLARIHVEGITPGEDGSPSVNVVFDIDANREVLVSTTTIATGQMQTVFVSANTGLSDADIGRMRQDALEDENKTLRKREQIEHRTRLDKG